LPFVHRVAVGLVRRWTSLRARDMTAATAGLSAVVLAAHPDDETLGCGSTIWQKTEAGAEVSIVIATDGGLGRPSLAGQDVELATLRRAEAGVAAERLGVPASRLQFLGFADQGLATHRSELTAAIERVLAERPAAEVYVPAMLDGHPDHSELASVARELAARGAFSGALYEYPIWYWGSLPRFGPAREWGRAAPFPRQLARELVRPVRVVRMTDRSRAAKRAALEAHESQIDWSDPGRTALPMGAGLVEEFLAGDELFFRVREGSEGDAG
jgi:LmbE family N-acetylglucosaminyl deacetylase